MKALTLTQPWATLMALQEKRIETRSWYTAYRGEMVIHSAKGFPRIERDMCSWEHFRQALHGRTADELPLSRGLCVVRVLGCIPTSKMHGAEMIMGHKPSMNELRFGNYEAGRWAWITEYVRPLEDVGAVRGALSLWDWEFAVKTAKLSQQEANQERSERTLMRGEVHL